MTIKDTIITLKEKIGNHSIYILIKKNQKWIFTYVDRMTIDDLLKSENEKIKDYLKSDNFSVEYCGTNKYPLTYFYIF